MIRRCALVLAAAFLALPLGSIDRLALTGQLRAIGRLEGATRFTGDPS